MVDFNRKLIIYEVRTTIASRLIHLATIDQFLFIRVSLFLRYTPPHLNIFLKIVLAKDINDKG